MTISSSSRDERRREEKGKEKSELTLTGRVQHFEEACLIVHNPQSSIAVLDGLVKMRTQSQEMSGVGEREALKGREGRELCVR